MHAHGPSMWGRGWKDQREGGVTRDGPEQPSLAPKLEQDRELRRTGGPQTLDR